MLVLSRGVTEGILIGDDVFIRVLHIRGSVVKIGIQAPSQVRVIRGELSGEPMNEPCHSDGGGMLVLSRKIDETICIGSDITVTVLKLAGKVRLGVDAPRDVRILRSELSEAA